VMVSIRPEAIVVERVGQSPATQRANSVTARVDQAIYRGFVSNYYLKTPSGGQIIVFEQNQSQQAGLRYTVGEEVVARWESPSNHVIARH
jgi:ABC-type Fe3+/spermidine/putrescine transport system ATPase subunit